MNCSPPGSSVHGISQARLLEWIAISFSRGSSQPKGQTKISSCISRQILYYWATREALQCNNMQPLKRPLLWGREGSAKKRERENHSLQKKKKRERTTLCYTSREPLCWYNTICRNLNMSRKLKGKKMLPERETNYIYISVLMLKMCIHYFQKTEGKTNWEGWYQVAICWGWGLKPSLQAQ